VLIPTIIVVALLNGVRIYGSVKELIEFNLVMLIGGILILALLIYSYIITRHVDEEN
jgi:hypothetical protein